MKAGVNAGDLRDRVYNGYLRMAVLGSIAVAIVGFFCMWSYWIVHWHFIGFALGWFFGLQTACIFFVGSAAFFFVIGIIFAGLVEVAMLKRWAKSP